MRKKYPLDEVIFYNTGMEFDAIYNVRDKLVPILLQKGIAFTELKPERPFIYDMLYKPVYSTKNGHHKGYGWCGGNCRWGTTFKTKSIDKYKTSINDEIIEYVGIAFDEKNRIKNKTYPLVEWQMTEKDCLNYCYAHGWKWAEQVSDGITIDLYSILNRVSCWCCANKNLKELRNIYYFLPSYWYRLRELQRNIQKPMKKYKRNGVPCGSIFDLEMLFKQEESQ